MAFVARSRAGDGYWDARFSWPSGKGVNGMVNAVAVSGSDVYVGGSFTMAGSVNATNIAKWDGNSWSALGDGVNNQVYAIAVRNPPLQVYAGGKFTQAGSASVNFIAKWNGSSWSALGSGLNNGVGGHVYALAVNTIGPSVLSVGGQFGLAVKSDGTLLTVNSIAQWIGNSWYALGTGVNGGTGVDGVVYGITVNGSDVYVGGDFTYANFVYTNPDDWVPANHIAKWNGAWSAITDLFGHNGVNGYVDAIVVDGPDVYVGGNFTDRGNNIARFDGTEPLWRPVGDGVNDTVVAMAPSGTNLYVGGSFTQAGGTNANHIAKWDGSSWSALGTGLNGAAEDLAVESGHVYVVGGFSTAGGKPSAGFAIWHETPVVRPNLVGIEFSGADCLISFSAQVGLQYYVERIGNLAATNWFAFTNVISGTSGIITVVDPGAANSATTCFYRVRRQ